MLLSEYELAEKINWLKHKCPTTTNKIGIFSYMKATFYNRRNWILTENPSITEIFNKYQRMPDYNGELIDEEFNLMFPNCADNFITIFPTYYQSRILSYVKFCKPGLLNKIQVNDNTLKILLLLIDILPVTNAMKRKKRQRKRQTINGRFQCAYKY